MLWATQERTARSAHRLTRRQRAAALVLTAVACCFIALDLSGSSLRTAHDGTRGALGSLYRGTDAVLGPVRRFVQGVPTAGSNETRVHALQQQNARLRQQLADAAANKTSLSRLRRLQLAADDLGDDVLPARVIAMSPAEGFDWTVTVDTGKADGVKVGQSVTDGYGLVGRVLHADASTAVVLLAVDPGSGAGARDLRTGEVGVATGAGSKGLTFRPLNAQAALRVGDTLSTGPSRSSSYVAGLAVGTITSVQVLPDGSTTATVSATVAPTSLDLLGIITGDALPGSGRTDLSPADPGGGR